MFRPLSTLLVLLFGLAFAAPAHAACTAGNPNANVVESTPTSAFTVNSSAGTVTHALTGLTWKQCSQGQSGAACQSTGTAGNNYGATTMTWSAALASAVADTTDGGGWRLPNKKELESIVETCGYSPSINQTVFPATVASFYWSASSYVPDPAYAWVVNFNVGVSIAYVKSDNYTVRLVRGGQLLDAFDAEADSIPSAFSFTAQTGAALGSTATSNTITVAGINTASPISISGGSYSINGGAYTSASGTVSNGNTVTLQQTTSASPVTLTTATLTIGGISAAFDVTTGKANQATVTLTSTSGTVGTPLTLSASGGSATGAYSYAVNSAGTAGCAISGGGTLNATAAGTCTVIATRAADSNYNSASSSATSVTFGLGAQAAVTLTSTSGTFGTGLTLSASGGSGTGAYSYAVNSTGTAGCSISGGSTLNATAAGTCTVIATRAADANYNAAASAATSVTFGLATQVITFGSAPTVVVGGTGTVTTTGGGSNIARVYASTSTGACTVNASTGVVTGVTAGTNNCTITADQGGNTNYSAAVQASLIFSINAAPASYTKIANNGADLADSATLGTAATDWACTRDNNSGLVWEVKTRDDTTPGLRDMTKTYTDYDSSYGTPDQINAATNSIGFTNAVNDTALCSSVEWRMPSTNELLGIVKSGVGAPTIDISFFPNTQSSVYWSGSTFASVPTSAEYVHFSNGVADHLIKTGAHQVRLVRGGPAFATSALSVTATGSGAGSVTSGGINCARAANSTTGTCTVGRGTNSVVTLTASATTGNVFAGWSGGVCSGTSSACTLTLDTAKAVTASFDVVDTSPDAFSFTAQTGAALSSTATSNTITVSGINSASPISISGGSYKIGSGSYVTSSATVNNGDTVTVQQSASGSGNTLTTATLTIGGSSAAFNVTTGSAAAVNGVCASIAATAFKPVSGLCTAGTASAVSVVFSWAWTCTGSGGGNTASCSAPNAVTATGSGSARASISGGSWVVDAANSGFVATSTVPSLPPGSTFPHGLLNLKLTGGGLGASATVVITYPSALPAGTVYWKYGRTRSNTTAHWYQFAGAAITGNTITLTLTDGADGDDDLAANGVITDPGGPGAPDASAAASIPTLSEWGMIILAGLMALFGWIQLRRRPALY